MIRYQLIFREIDTYRQFVEWCKLNLGVQGDTWDIYRDYSKSAYWNQQDYYIVFLVEAIEDLTLFKMTWGEHVV